MVGYAYAVPYRPRLAYRFTVEDSIYIEAAHTGRGLGRLLLAAVIEAFELNGADGGGDWRQRQRRVDWAACEF